MAGRNRFELAKKLVEVMKEQGNEVSDTTLRVAIARALSGTEKGIKEYVRLMHSTGLIKESEIGWILLDDDPEEVDV